MDSTVSPSGCPEKSNCGARTRDGGAFVHADGPASVGGGGGGVALLRATVAWQFSSLSRAQSAPTHEQPPM
jgi:hypothetical protein